MKQAVIEGVNDLLFYLLKNNYFGELTYSMSLIILNMISYSFSESIYAISKNCFNLLTKYVSKENKYLFDQELKRVFDMNIKYLEKKPVMTVEKIKTTILQIPKYRIKMLNIKEIFLYGSYAKGTNNEYSDLDFHVTLCSDEYDLNVSALNIKNYFDEIFLIDTDITTTVFGQWYNPRLDDVFYNKIKIL